MAKVFFVIGGNVGEREWYLEEARRLIADRIGSICKTSSVYETEPWGFESPINFLNQVLVVETKLTPASMLLEMTYIENTLGRKRNGTGYAPRTIDIDILFYNHEVYFSPNLIIPQKNLHTRRFVLTPLVEVEPDFIHPLLSVTASELLACCSDNSKVWVYKPEVVPYS